MVLSAGSPGSGEDGFRLAMYSGSLNFRQRPVAAWRAPLWSLQEAAVAELPENVQEKESGDLQA